MRIHSSCQYSPLYAEIQSLAEPYASDAALSLVCDANLKLSLQNQQDNSHLAVDFLTGSTRHRILSSGKRQSLGKALAMHKQSQQTIVDATAGQGLDAFVLAYLGAEMHMLERHPIAYLLLKDGLLRAKSSGDEMLAEASQRLHLQHANGVDALRAQCAVKKVDSLYLDPMFPARNKTAKVKQKMQFFHQLIGDDADASDLLAQALQCSVERIVVKRPAKSAPLLPKVHHQIAEKTIRYDVYLPQ